MGLGLQIAARARDQQLLLADGFIQPSEEQAEIPQAQA
jgi:hypothetical protein